MSLKLRPYQDKILDALRQGFASGKRSQILYAPTGAGKTEMAIHLLNATKLKGNKSAMLLDRIVLCDQTSQRMERYKIEHGVMQSGHWRYRPFEHIQVCSAQTLEKRGSFPGLNLLIVDECFTAGTLISTPSGDKDISIVRCGDTVYNATGVGKVVSVMARPTVDLVKLEFEDGTTIECTDNHPIFTNRGWVKAAELEIGRVSYSIEGLRMLWQSVYADDKNGCGQGGSVEYLRSVDASRSLLKILFEETEKSDEQSGIQREDEGQTSGDKASTDSARREWQIAAAASTCFASRIRGRLAGRACDSDQDAASKDWLSNLLQTGHCQHGDDDWYRVGRWFSLLTGEESARFQEDRISCFPRVVGVSRVKCDRIEPLFNLHISGHPSYFANGKLVHNCHQTRAQTVEFIKNNPDVKVIGLTATPFTKGLGNVYEGVVSSITTKELVDQKMLVPLRVFIAKEIDMSGAKKVAGEWSQAETSKRGMQITGDVVAEWVKMTHEVFGRPRKTIVFCSGVDHGADLARKFAEAGFNFISLSYRDDDDFKKEIIEEFSKPDTEIHGLIATDILTKGFDAPDIMIGVSARPFSKSLSSHIQQMGRVMRSNQDDPEGKTFALWLDHSGNYLRFREEWEEIYEHGVTELDDGKEKPKKEPTEKEKKEAKCPVCEAYMPRYMDTCAHCGYVREKKSLVQDVPGEMTELQTMSRENKQAWWSQIQWYVENTGKSPGWAAHTFKEKFGVWPRNLSDRSEIPSDDVAKFIEKKKRAFIRKMKRGG
jgi:superfamily II DNA or RNA helicase